MALAAIANLVARRETKAHRRKISKDREEERAAVPGTTALGGCCNFNPPGKVESFAGRSKNFLLEFHQRLNRLDVARQGLHGSHFLALL